MLHLIDELHGPVMTAIHLAVGAQVIESRHSGNHLTTIDDVMLKVL